MTENQPGSPFPFEATSRDESPDDPMDDEITIPLASSFAPSSGPLTIPSGPSSLAMSRSTSAPFRVGMSTSRSNSRQHSRNPTNPTELLKRQIAQAFQYISSTIHQSHDESQIPLEPLSDDARVQYANLQLLQTRLAKGETIVDKELSDARQALLTLEGATQVEREHLTAEIAGEFRRQEAKQKEDAELAEDRDKILEREVLELKDKVKNQDVTWQRILHDHEERADQLLKQQKDNADAQQQKDRQKARDLLDKQPFEFQALIQTLTERIDHAEKPHYTIPPTDGGDGDPGPSNRGQQNPWIPPDGINPDKESASTPRQNKGKEVDQGGNNQPPPPPGNTGGDPDPDDDDDDDNDKKGGDGRGRRGGRPEHNARRRSIPRDTSPRTRAMLEFMQSLSTSQQPTKNTAEPPYVFQGEDNQDVRNWLTACEDYFDRNPTQWENHSHRIVFALGKTKGNKVAPFSEKYRKVMGCLGDYTQDPSYSTWERFRQEIIKRYIGIEEERRALEEMDKIIYKGKIDTYLLLLENLNIKAGLTGIAWRVKVENKLLQDILRRLSHYKFNVDDHWIETLWEVGRQEEELLQREKLSKSISTPHNPAPKGKREGSEKRFNTKFEKDNKPRKDNTSRWKSPQTTTVKRNGNNSKDEHANWKKAHEGIAEEMVEKRKREKQCTRCTLDNHTWRKCRKPIVVATTFAYGNKGNPKPYRKPRTSTLAIHNPPPSRSEQIPKVNRVHREMPTQVWELSDTEMT